MRNFPDTLLDDARSRADPPADEVINELAADLDESTFFGLLGKPAIELAESEDTPKLLQSFIGTSRPEPDWLRPQLLSFGRGFFQTYAPEIMRLLGVRSLPFCYAASPGNKVLLSTKKLREQTGKRLHDTADFIINLMKPGAFSSQQGYYHINQTRFIHAAVRYGIRRHGDWDEGDGVPINQEDMAGTNLAFSFVVLDGLRKMGYELGELGVKGFLHLWKYIGYQLHIDDKLLVGTEVEARRLQNRIGERHFRETKAGRELIEALLGHYRQFHSPIVATVIESQMRYFLPEEVGAALGLERRAHLDEAVHRTVSLAARLAKMTSDSDAFESVLAEHERREEMLASQ